MADGSTKPISDVDLGDEVLTTDTETGQTTGEPVAARITGTGIKHLVDVTIDTDGPLGDASSTLTATGGHPFWLVGPGHWTAAQDLRVDDVLLTASGESVAVTAIVARTQNERVHNLSVEKVHTYYVLAGKTPVLVHNCGTAVYHYTDRAGFNGIKSGDPYEIRPGSSKNGAGPFVTTRSPADLTAPNAFKKLGLTSTKSEYVVEFTVPKSSLVPLRGGRGGFIFAIPGGVKIPRPGARYIGPTADWGPPA